MSNTKLDNQNQPYPVRVDAAPEPSVSRWLWLVKWLLLIPHFVVLFFLWVGFLAVSVVAFFAILITGRYPRGLRQSPETVETRDLSFSILSRCRS